MPITTGQGNPDWTREEVLLALDLYNKVKPTLPSAKDSRVIALSQILRALPVHDSPSKKDNFRNPSSVAFKIQNLHAVATGKGLTNVAKADREVWAEFSDKPNLVKTLARAIVEASETVSATIEADPEDEDVEYPEGNLLYRIHKVRERSVALRKTALKAWRAESHGLRCELCGTKANAFLGPIGEAIFDVHHLKPLSEVGQKKTKVTDLALLCASCHRLTHRICARDLKSHGIPELKAIIAI